MTADPVSPLRPSRRRPGKVAQVLPMLGIVDEADQGAWVARTFGGVELGSYPTRAEAAEALVVYGVFGA